MSAGRYYRAYVYGAGEENMIPEFDLLRGEWHNDEKFRRDKTVSGKT